MNEYQVKASETALGMATHEHYGPLYNALKLNGEAGEVAELIGKWMRGDFGVFQPGGDNWMPNAQREQLVKELGDVLWYLSALADWLGVSLQFVAQVNLLKLADRKERGVLQGSGSDR